MGEERTNEGLLRETQEVLASNWGVTPVGLVEEDLNRRLLLEALAERILYLLRNNMDKLLSSMYILDVSETRFNDAMNEPDMESRAYALAEVVYDRETEKIESRRKYAGPTYGRLDGPEGMVRVDKKNG